MPLNARPLSAPPLNTRTLAPRAYVPVVDLPFARLLDAKHTQKRRGARRIRDPRSGI